ncbi:hypothetical protein HK107_06830 [Parvularcula sp. ZS-1/3]|uniref:Uncharacterized protein n=1 Tax=Parvularcula mediterranea TaxID=2732508 RepID=A0A7Y3RL23_9PROT|nr:hypothetical protein [Parvularcula mediterranea]NNU16033.1 hypothetical protein [Parvularcula mediterranea]
MPRLSAGVKATWRLEHDSTYVHSSKMNRLEKAEHRFLDTLSRVEAELSRGAAARAEAANSLELIDKIEKRAEAALRQLRDVIRQGEGAQSG